MSEVSYSFVIPLKLIKPIHKNHNGIIHCNIHINNTSNIVKIIAAAKWPSVDVDMITVYFVLLLLKGGRVQTMDNKQKALGYTFDTLSAVVSLVDLVTGKNTLKSNECII